MNLINQDAAISASKTLLDEKRKLADMIERRKKQEDPKKFADLGTSIELQERAVKLADRKLQQAVDETVDGISKSVPTVKKKIQFERTRAISISALDDLLQGLREIGFPTAAEKIFNAASEALGISRGESLGRAAKRIEKSADDLAMVFKRFDNWHASAAGGAAEHLKTRLLAAGRNGTLPYLP